MNIDDAIELVENKPFLLDKEIDDKIAGYENEIDDLEGQIAELREKIEELEIEKDDKVMDSAQQKARDMVLVELEHYKQIYHTYAFSAGEGKRIFKVTDKFIEQVKNGIQKLNDILYTK